MSAAVINIALVSDSICPFCYLGYKKLLAALNTYKAQSPTIKFNIQFQPFLLDNTLPTNHGVNKRERYIKKFGSAEKVAEMEKTMRQRGEEYGITFNYDGNVRQTTDSHRIIEKAYSVGGEPLQRSIVEKLFKGYFEEAKDPAEPEWLAEQASEAGVGSKQEMIAFLKTDEGKAEVEEGISRAYAMQIRGVPFFIINKEGEQRVGVSGAQEPETFIQVFDKILSK